MSVENQRRYVEAGPMAAAFVALAHRLFAATTVQEVLEHVVEAGRAAIEGADMVSVTVRGPDGRFHTPVASAPLAVTLDELQYRFDEGPCVEAARTPGPDVIISADLRAGTEFPQWGPAAAEAGAGSVLAVGLLPTGGELRTAALNLYSFDAAGLDKSDRDVAIVLAAHASTALAMTGASTAKDIKLAHLEEALRSRDVIGQAKGILMERRGISENDAFDVLRTASQSLNIKLAMVAETLATRRADI
jgi:hypothetical protein